VNNLSDTAPLEYRPHYEHFEDDEAESIEQLQKLFVDMATVVAEKEGHAFRAVHAKGQALLRGSLIVSDDLPPELAQGIFARPAEYPVIVRFSAPPAEQLSDNVSTPRAVAVKVLNVGGEHVQESTENSTQDFLMTNGPVFLSAGPKSFLGSIKLLAATTEKMPKTKEVISKALRGVESVLEAVGVESASVKGMGGQPPTHPLSETYFSQVPFLYGNYMAKFSLVPASNLTTLADITLQSHDDDAQREALNLFFESGATPAEWDFRVQLCTDIEKMPIEDASVEWPTSLSPYQTVARLVINNQVAWRDDQSIDAEDQLSFDPWHATTAHRPLGAINRARKTVIAASRDFRSTFNKCPLHEPS